MASPNGKKAREFELLIADAQRQFDVNGKVQHMSFWAFKVMCRSFLPTYQNPPLFPEVAGLSGGKAQNFINSGAGYVDYCSWHRYSDFEWLVEQFEADLTGLIIPPLPPKENDATKDKVQDLVSSKENDNPKLVPFVQTRIRHLNMWAQVIMDMTDLHESPHLKAFIAMEESQWVSYRAKVDASRKGTGVAAVAGRISSFFGKISNRNVVVYDDVCEFGQVRLHQMRMAEHLRMCQYRMKDVENLALNQPKELSDLSSDFVVNANKPLAYPLITNGHFVAHGEKRGVVRHVDQYNHVYVEWTTRDSFGNQVPSGEGLERLPITSLTFPESGVSDPAMFACLEAASQVESFFAYIQHRSESRDLEKLIDLLWFWRAYCEKVGVTIKNLADLEIKRQDVAKDAASIKDAAKKQARLEEATLLSSRVTNSELTFKRFYATLFRPLQKTGLFNINMLVGRVSYNLLNDDDWPNRLLRCDKALNPDFDVPAEVTRMLEALARGDAPPATIARSTHQPAAAAASKSSPTTNSPPAASPKEKQQKAFAPSSSDSEDEEAARRRARAEAKAARKLEKARQKEQEEAESQQRSESVAPAHESD